MGIFQSILPCVSKSPSTETDYTPTHKIIHTPEFSSSTSASSPIKGRDSPGKFEISHPYPLVPGYRHNSPIPHRSTTSSPASPISGPTSKDHRGHRIGRGFGSPRVPGSPLSPRRVSSLPQAMGIYPDSTTDERKKGRKWSMDDTTTHTHHPRGASSPLRRTHFESETATPDPVIPLIQPRSLSSSPSPYSPPTSFRSLLPTTTPKRTKYGRRGSFLIEEKSVGSGKKLRKVLRVEGDWEIVREGDVGGTAFNGRPDDRGDLLDEGVEMEER